jgi:hypothetical protein
VQALSVSRDGEGALPAILRIAIIANYNSIFYNGAVWHTPEDLCFFKGSTLISGSVSHENICFVYNENLQLPGLRENGQEESDASLRQTLLIRFPQTG